MANKEQDKFIVINRQHLSIQPLWVQDALRALLEKINNDNKYIVCNQDEPYAEEVWGVILDGEDAKQ